MNDNVKQINDTVDKILRERTDIVYIPSLSLPIAEALDGLGYRKQEDTVKEFAKKLRITARRVTMNDNIKPCPFCGGNSISLSLEMDCYSSWVIVKCNKCHAYSTTGADKPNSAFPNPVEDWENVGIRRWNMRAYKTKVEVIKR